MQFLSIFIFLLIKYKALGLKQRPVRKRQRRDGRLDVFVYGQFFPSYMYDMISEG